MKTQLLMREVSIESLCAPERPVRLHSASKLQKLRRHIERYGVLVPLLVHFEGRIVDGIARYQTAIAIGLTHLNVIDISHLPHDDLRALRLALNRLQQEATWDPTAVAVELKFLAEVGFDLDFTGFDTVEIENYLEIGDVPSEVEDLDASLAAGPVITRPGDIWVMGSGSTEHRVACGDFRDEGLCKVLFSGLRAAACFTDSPYNLRISGHVSGTGKHAEFAMATGEMSDEAFEAFLSEVLALIFTALAPDGVAFLCMDWRHIRHLLDAAKVHDLELLNLAVWVKSNPGMGSFYRSQHELIAVFKRPGETHRNNVQLGRHGRSRSNVWEYRGVNVFGPERHLLDLHPTVKPSAMVADAIRDVTMPGEAVFDSFLGSGTTLIAAERTQRRCLGIEIEPKYVDLAVRRWQLATGRAAVRLSDGVSFPDAESAARSDSPTAKESGK